MKDLTFTYCATIDAMLCLETYLEWESMPQTQHSAYLNLSAFVENCGIVELRDQLATLAHKFSPLLDDQAVVEDIRKVCDIDAYDFEIIPELLSQIVRTYPHTWTTVSVEALQEIINSMAGRDSGYQSNSA